MQIGIIGKKYTGKTTLFNAITRAGIPTGQGGVDANRAMARVPDPRLERLTSLFSPRRTVPAAVEWVDVPGFAGGVGPEGSRDAVRFLEHARKVDALALVVRCFDGGHGAPDPVAELESLALELALADLQIVENRLERLAKDKGRKGKVENPLEPPLMQRLREQLEADRPLRDLILNVDDQRIVSGFTFLTRKPLMIVLNHAEGATIPEATETAARVAGSQVVTLCASMEEELTQLSPAEAAEFLAEMGIDEPALDLMIRAAYGALHLTTFFTVGEDECRAWAVNTGARAPRAAGVIHSDMERGFIRAEVVAYEDLVTAGSIAATKTAHTWRLEGKNYEVQEGDVLGIRFNV